MKTQNSNGHDPERFESDTEKIIHRHLANEDDVITDEDLQSVRVGLTPPQIDDTTSQTNMEQNS